MIVHIRVVCGKAVYSKGSLLASTQSTLGWKKYGAVIWGMCENRPLASGAVGRKYKLGCYLFWGSLSLIIFEDIFHMIFDENPWGGFGLLIREISNILERAIGRKCEIRNSLF